MAQTMLAELFRRRVFTAPEDVSQVVPALFGHSPEQMRLRNEPSIAL